MKRLAVAALVLLAACSGPDATIEPPASGPRIEVSENATVFTLFALLNAAGYDVENRGAMHPVRVTVRAELDRRVDPALRERIRAFYARHREDASPWSYSVVAMATSGPPAFTGTQEWKEIAAEPRFGSLAELHGLLRDFYKAVDVPALYKTVEPEYAKYVSAYDAVIHREAAAALAYCRLKSVTPTSVPEGERVDPIVIPNLLESYEKAFSFVLGGRFVSVEGPQAEIGYNPHEFIHAVTNPAVYGDATRSMAKRLQPLAEAAKADSVPAFVDEDLVRAVALRYLAAAKPDRLPKLTEAMLKDYRDGHPLERFFWEQLAEYEKSSVDLRRYYPEMLARLDPEAELARWRGR